VLREWGKEEEWRGVYRSLRGSFYRVEGRGGGAVVAVGGGVPMEAPLMVVEPVEGRFWEGEGKRWWRRCTAH
jgi:hypothetical protein